MPEPAVVVIDPTRLGVIGGDPDATAARLKHVAVDFEAIRSGSTQVHKVLKELSEHPGSSVSPSAWELVLPAAWRAEPHSVTDDDRANFIGMMIAIDYRHWVSPDIEVSAERAPPSLHYAPIRTQQFWYDAGEAWVRGSMAMTTALRDAAARGSRWYDPRCCPALSIDRMEEILSFHVQPLDEPSPPSATTADHVRRVWPRTPIPALQERMAILREVAAALRSSASSFYDLARRSGQRLFDRGGGFVERVAALYPSRYDDAASLDGHRVELRKLAQLTAVALVSARRCFLDPTALSFVDIASLAVCPDYQLPKALRSAGILVYSTPLARLVDEACLLPENSPEEVELRVASMVAGRALQALLPNETALSIDYALWLVGRSNSSSAHHLTVTSMY